MKKVWKKACSLALTVAVLSSYSLTANALGEETKKYETEKYLIEKVSNPTSGEGEVDGILTGQDQAREQSYSWSMIEYGDSIYIGTCYNPIAGIYYRNVISNLTSKGMDAEKAAKIASKLIELMYDGAMYTEGISQTSPVIVKVNKESYDAEIVYKYTAGRNNMAGYRMAAEFNDKLYFVGSGYPTNNLVEIDPINNTSNVVFESTALDSAFSTGIRGLYVYDNQLIMSMSSDTSDIKGVRILTTSNPSSGEWTEIANQDTFLDLPACYKRDGINGGGIWDIVSFNGYLYVSIVTSKTDPDTLVNNKQGFAMFRGSKEEDGTWSWKMIIGDKNQGALYDFGLGVKESGAGNLFVYDNYLYIGNYNDPMLDLAEIPNNGNFELVYNDLVNAVNLYRMDENENIEMVVGQPNEEFVAGPIGNMGPGFDDPMNQYVWRMGEYNGKLFIGTFDASTLLNGFTQLTNGELINMPKDEFIRKLNLVKELIELLISKEVNLVTEENQIELYDANTNSIDQLVGALDLLENNLDETAVNNTEARNTNESIIDMYYEIEALYEETKESLTDDIISEIEEILSIININNIKCYFAINEYCKNATKGFDLLVSEDGVNFQVITRNGFNDKYNHGLRTFQATEKGLFLGTANPFYGTQLWLLKDKDSFVEDDNNENPGDENDTPGEDSEISNDSTLKDTVEDSNKDQVIVVENQNNKDKQHNKLPVTGGINSAFVIVVAVILMMFGFKIYSYNRKQ